MPGFSYHADIIGPMREVRAWLAKSPHFANYVKESLRWTGDQLIDGDGLLHKTSFKFEWYCLLYTSPSPRDRQKSRMPSSA